MRSTMHMDYRTAALAFRGPEGLARERKGELYHAPFPIRAVSGNFLSWFRLFSMNCEEDFPYRDEAYTIRCRSVLGQGVMNSSIQ
jgi:hypothetical protein